MSYKKKYDERNEARPTNSKAPPPLPPPPPNDLVAWSPPRRNETFIPLSISNLPLDGSSLIRYHDNMLVSLDEGDKDQYT